MLSFMAVWRPSSRLGQMAALLATGPWTGDHAAAASPNPAGATGRAVPWADVRGGHDPLAPTAVALLGSADGTPRPGRPRMAGPLPPPPCVAATVRRSASVGA
jgi:hypothetical protein